MSPGRATAEFEITVWEEEPVHESSGGGLVITRARVVKSLRGDITGSSIAWLTMSVVGETSMAYLGVELFDVAVHGRPGTFVLLHDALSAGDGRHAWWTVQDGTGTGQLTGLTGTAVIDPRDGSSHGLTLDYSLPDGHSLPDPPG